nr:hypothetical protein [Eubacteriales bacterium]
PGENTTLYRLQKKPGEEAYTVFEIASPSSSDGDNAEATLALMRPVDSESGGAEFLDLYNNGYADSRQMGIRVQSRGTGQLRDFVFDFNSGSGVFEVLRIRTNGIRATKNIGIVNAAAGLELYTGEGELGGTVGRKSDRLAIENPISGASFELFDVGYHQMYFPTGGLYIYLDEGSVYVNDVDVMSPLRSYPVGAVYMSVSSTSPATLFGGTWSAIAAGTFLVAAGTGYAAGATGGAATHSHTTPNHAHTTPNMTLALWQIPSHTHAYGQVEYLNINGATYAGIAWNYSHQYTTGAAGGGGAHGHGNTGNAAPTTNAASSLPPWKAFYMWERTA